MPCALCVPSTLYTPGQRGASRRSLYVAHGWAVIYALCTTHALRIINTLYIIHALYTIYALYTIHARSARRQPQIVLYAAHGLYVIHALCTLHVLRSCFHDHVVHEPGANHKMFWFDTIRPVRYIHSVRCARLVTQRVIVLDLVSCDGLIAAEGPGPAHLSTAVHQSNVSSLLLWLSRPKAADLAT